MASYGHLISIFIILTCMCCNVLSLFGKKSEHEQKTTTTSGWKPISTDPKTGKNVTLKVTEKELLTKIAPKGVELRKFPVDVKTDRSGRILIEQGNSNAFYVWLPTDILNMDHGNRQHSSHFRDPQSGSAFQQASHYGPGPFSAQGPPEEQSNSNFQQNHDQSRHRPNYLPDQGSDVQPGGVRIIAGFLPSNSPVSRPQPAYQPPPGAAPNPITQVSANGPQIYIPQQEIPRPNPQSYHGPRAENGPQYQFNTAPHHYHSSQVPQFNTVNSRGNSGSGGYGRPDLDDEDVPEVGYGAAPRPLSTPPPQITRPEPGYGSTQRRPTPDFTQAPQTSTVERGYGSPRRPSSYGQPQHYHPGPPQFKNFDPTVRPIGIVSARPQPIPQGYGQQVKRPVVVQEPFRYNKPMPTEQTKPVSGGGGGYGRPEPLEDDDYPQPKPQPTVTKAPNNEFFQGTASPIRVPTPDEEAGVGVIEPRSLPMTCAATPKPPVRGQNIRDIAKQLRADFVFNDFGVSEADIYSAAGDGQFTVFLPANEAKMFTNPELLSMWRQDRESFMRTIANHVILGQIGLDQLRRGGSYVTKASQNAIINSRAQSDGVVTVNGQRIIYGDISLPNGGLLHIVGGFLHPVAEKDVVTLVQDCGKYDGFVTLSSGTGFNQELSGSPSGYTLFLPSNDALSKVPKEELELIRTNTTALREFLRYHVAEGIHYSHDLHDGQYLRTLHNGAPLRVSVNTDGCRRRLYEVNNSPLYRADIPAANGVVHIVDWVLLPSDHKWCRNVVLP